MGAFRKLNSYPCRACIPEFREPEDSGFAHPPAQGYFQDYFKLLEKRKLKLLQTPGAYGCSGEISASTQNSSKAANTS